MPIRPSLSVACLLLLGSAASAAETLKVFILAGQSNMVGAGEVVAKEERNGGKGSLEHLVRASETRERFAHLVDASGAWVERDDVWISFFERRGGLSVGFGAREDKIGPELGFGHVVGDAIDEPVLLLKVAWGGKSVGKDFRPPSAGGEVGESYTALFAEIRRVLGDLDALFPGLEHDGVELVGLGWHQGWNDRVNQAFNDAYEENLSCFIRDARRELDTPALPFVIAETGMSGHEEKHPRALSLMRAQAAVAAREEFRGTVAFVGTKDFYRPKELSPNGQAYHWNNNAETYYLIGDGMGRAMLELLAGDDASTAARSGGADWPQWRGPERTGVSRESGWSAAGAEAPLWRRTLGIGHSSFAVADGRVYTLGHDRAERLDTVYCLDIDTGEDLWTHSYPSLVWDNAHSGGTLTTPTVVGDAVYTSNREGKVFCFDAETGGVRWSRDQRAEMELVPPTWGFSASPLVVDDLVLMNVDRLVALDRATGDEVWVSWKPYGISYSTPAPFELDGRTALASLSGDGLAVIDVEEGSEVAFFPWVKRPQIYPMTPVVMGDRIFISAGYSRGCAMLQLAEGELTELWGGRMMRNKMSGCVLHAEHLFGFDESILKCIDLEGNMKWRVRGLGTGSMTVAGDRLVILDGKGQVIVAEANPDEYVELSKQRVFDDGTGWSTPVLSHGRIFCRSSTGEVACLDHRGAAGDAVALASDARSLLEATEVLARHTAAMGGREALGRVGAIRMKGPGESLRNTVRKGPVELDWAASIGFVWRDDTGFQLGYDADAGWIAGTRAGPVVLEGEPLDALQEAGDLLRLFDPASAYADPRTLGRRVFDNRPCLAIAATTREGHARTLYFEEETMLLAGHEGDGIALWTLGDYRRFDGLMVPTRWAFYEPELGEMSSATFEEVEVSAEPDAVRFERPGDVAMLLRSPEEIEVHDARLRELHADLLGAWLSDDGTGDIVEESFVVSGGFLQIRTSDRPPARLSEPDADGAVHVLGAPYVRVIPIRGEDGELERIEIRIDGDLESTLRREG
ncbi:MAG: PQQ-binding-like beta-propeller repeat protein [Planctomycetota bacterium]